VLRYFLRRPADRNSCGPGLWRTRVAAGLLFSENTYSAKNRYSIEKRKIKVSVLLLPGNREVQEFSMRSQNPTSRSSPVADYDVPGYQPGAHGGECIVNCRPLLTDQAHRILILD